MSVVRQPARVLALVRLSAETRRAIAALLAAAIVVAACSAAAPASPTPAPPSPSTAPSSVSTLAIPAALQGTWTATIAGTTASSGLWTLTITDSDMLFTNPVGGDPFSLSPTAVTETSLTLAAAADCPDQTTVTAGTYSMKLQGSTLKVTRVSDTCGDRAAILTTSPWTRKP